MKAGGHDDATPDVRPDFLIVGAPKAGTTALHAALTRHPDVFMSDPKEPKYWMCDDAPPPHWRGPGHRHSQREWVWRRADYERLFAGAPAATARGESTPFYLWHRAAQRRIAEHLPEAKLVAVVRDPIDRAYSNWMHLWSDGLEPVADFEEAFALEHERIVRGWAPFWRYSELGRYGEQLAHLYSYLDPERVLVLRYRDIVDDPPAPWTAPAPSSASAPGRSTQIPHDNARSFVRAGPAAALLGRVVRAGAGRASSLPRRCGAAPALRWSPGSRAGRPAPAAALARGPGPAAAEVRRRHPTALADHRPVLRRLALDREPRVLQGAQPGPAERVSEPS